MASGGSGIIAFDRFEIDPARGELRCDGQPVAIEPRALDLITHLARHPGQVQSRDELIDAVWGGRIVSDSAISSCVAAARKALGDDGTAQRYIRNIPRRGFRFEADPRTRNTDAGPPVLPDQPSVAVLPFQNMSGDPEQAYFSDGITDDIITDLSRYDELFVIARHSSFIYRDTSVEVERIAQALGVQYLVEGSVRRAGDRIRVTAQLMDPHAGNQLWAERYDRDLEDIFEVQDEIVAVIVNSLAGEIRRQHYKRSRSKSANAIDAYDHVLRAMEHSLRISPQDNVLAQDEIKKALTADPDFARAHALLALTYINEGANLWGTDPASSFLRAYQAACAAVAADDRDPWAYAMLGIAELWHHHAHDRAIANMKHSVGLNPSNSYFRGLYAYVLAFTGEPDTALVEIDKAIRTNPHIPAVYHLFRGRALLVLRRVDEAMACLRPLVARMPGHSTLFALIAVLSAASGRIDDARDAVDALRKSSPNYTLGALRNHLPFAEKADRDFILDNLQKAGLPE